MKENMVLLERNTRIIWLDLSGKEYKVDKE